jgi:hypothetical protein
MRSQLQTQSRLLDQQEEILKQINPNIMEAAKQQLDLMQGRETPGLRFAREGRQRQRQQLENQLRDQLGSAYATSTAGQDALRRFDAQSQELEFQTQQAAISGLSQLTGQGIQSRIGAIAPSISFGDLAFGTADRFRRGKIAAGLGAPISSASPFAAALGAGGSLLASGASAFGKFAGAQGGFGAGAMDENFGIPVDQSSMINQPGTFGGAVGGFNNQQPNPFGALA